jgi:hypothetical protein
MGLEREMPSAVRQDDAVVQQDAPGVDGEHQQAAEDLDGEGGGPPSRGPHPGHAESGTRDQGTGEQVDDVPWHRPGPVR